MRGGFTRSRSGNALRTKSRAHKLEKSSPRREETLSSAEAIGPMGDILRSGKKVGALIRRLLSRTGSPSPGSGRVTAPVGINPLPLRLFFPKLTRRQMVLSREKRYRFVLECGATGENGGVR